MRIGLFTDTYTPDINGVVTSIVTLKDALERLGHTVFVITNQPVIMSSSFEDNILRLPGVEIKFLYGYTLSSPIHISAMHVIEEMELDVIHVHSEFGIGMFGRNVAKNLHIPLVSTYHTTYEDYTHYVNLLGLKSIDNLSKLAVAKMSRIFTKQAQVVIAPSAKTKAMLLGYDIKKEISVIPTGLDLSRFEKRDEEKIASIRKELNLEGQKTFVYIGRLAKEKSIDFVLHGFKALKDIGMSANLVIVGGGPSMDELKDLSNKLGVANMVQFVGPVSSDHVVSYYQIADAFISASLTETQGLTYIEALACGLCVFARPDEPLDGIIIDDETGYLFQTYEEFAEKAKSFIEASDEKISKLNSNALNRSQSFDSKAFGEAVIDVYQRASQTYHGNYTVQAINLDLEGKYQMNIETKGTQESIVVDEFVMSRRGIKEGDTLTRIELNELDDDQHIYNAFQLALKRIAVKDYTSYEMREYLNKKVDLAPDQIEIVIDLLKKRRFIDDNRYLRDRIYYHQEQKRGNQRIIEDLEKRGFSEQQVLEYIDDEDYETYIQRGVSRAQSFYDTLRDGSQRQREDRVSQHLVRQGFEYSNVKEILNHLNKGYSEDQEIESLKELMEKAKVRYARRYDDVKDIKNRVVKYALSKGYDYDLIVRTVTEVFNED